MKTLIAISERHLKQMIFSGEALQRLSFLSEIDYIPEELPFNSDDLINIISEYDAVITSWGSPKLTREVIMQAGKLRFLGHAAGTIVPVVDKSIFDRPVVLVNANEALAKSTAEGAVALMMAGAWRLFDYERRLRNSEWPEQTRQSVPGLSRQTIGLIGFGEVAREIVRLLQPFEPNILVCSRHLSTTQAAALGVQLCELEELLLRSGIISLHSTLTSSTRGMIGERELSRIREGALILNTARGALIDEQALIRLLQQGKHYAVLDVFEQEPLPVNHPFLALDNVVCFPHISGTGGYWRSQLGLTVVKLMERWLRGESVEQIVTRDRFERLTRG